MADPQQLLGQMSLFSTVSYQPSSPATISTLQPAPIPVPIPATAATTAAVVATNPPNPPPENQKIVRVRSGCWTCKARRRKCDEAKPFCMNCVKNNRQCEGYGLRLSFDVDDSRHIASGVHFDVKGRPVVGFRRRPRLKESMAARSTSSAAPAIPGSVFVDAPISTDGTVPVQEPVARPAGKELKFIVQKSFDGAKRPRKKRTVSDEDVAAKKIKWETASTTSTSSPEVSATNQTSSLADVIKHEPTDQQQVEQMVNMFKSSSRSPSRLSEGNIMDLHQMPNNTVARVAPSSIELQQQSHPAPSVSRDLGMFWSIAPDEQELLQYYFTDLTPLLDNLSNSPLAGLALTYCTHDLALSSFLCLASLHLSTRHKSEVYYATGLEYHSKTIKFLGDVLNAVSVGGSNASSPLDIASQQQQPALPPTANNVLGLPNISNIRNQVGRNQPNLGRGLGVAVLTVIYFLITYEILDTGKSATVRSHLAAFSSIIEDRDLAADVLSAPNGMFLFRMFAWYDILLAACSKDYRAPHLSGPYFFPLSADDSGVEGVMGCPDEVMLAISDTCHLRHTMKYAPETLSFVDIQNRVSEIESRIRNYSCLKKWDGRESYSYVQHIIGTQCWAQAAAIFLLRSTGMDPNGCRVAKCVEEFRKLHSILEVGTEADRQMVWPIFVVGCELKGQEERNQLTSRIEKLFGKTHCGSWKMTKDVLQDVWKKNCSWETVLSSKEWENFDFLAL
ncbi:fungal-specific transcription factor domain-containing protein [Lipomyces arxii]|uniref:fungal-specific transcription factor domain-containing protein n=1 Tax=Lipomyces arxii TaxID=56418 RepID=UPI0034CE3227